MYFDQPYNRHEFVSFLRHDFLPNLDFVQEETPVAFPIQTQYCCDIATKLGTCQSLDLVIYEIRHHSKSDARVGMSKEAFRLLANEFEDKALVIFIPEDNTDNYRLSFIEITLHQDEDSSRVKKTYSNPRRYSYYLGKGIACYTPNKYLNAAGRVTSIEDLRNRFSVEVLTKEFYQELSDWYAWAIKIIRFPNNIDDKEDDDKFNNEGAIRLITRLIFVWFLKQRNLIPNEFFDENYLREKLIKDFKPYQMDGLLHDRGEVKYYTAILQNLFFAMLNCPITSEGSEELSERHFRKLNEQGKPSRSDYDNNKLMRYESYFKDPQLFVNLANRTVPFLNGGLFDCLDEKDKGIYYDGFSDSERSLKSLYLPDFLFFSPKTDVDLSVWYNDKKKKKVTVRGIIRILKRYNFTIEENTPFDQEVSLDPELLGKVFENLLASYNPETQTTARKQTGSFYTPREIVQYMVDESLVAHLKRTVDEELEPQFRQLMQYTDDEVNLTDEQRKQIMQSLYNCKVLDPACGSGAFPMGMLQQMVHILSRIDPGNTQWREMMLDMAADQTSEVDRTASSEYLEIKADIIRSFDENVNRPDYARKLYLIENCIYGVDIQSIAIQISKLRFFISLIVDQKTNNNPADNFGIRPLPNLEAKFVAANTLIPLTKNEGELGRTPAVIAIENNLKEANHKIFRAKSIKTKRRWKDRLKELRKDLATQLANDGFLSADAANQLASWDMFDQNASASFFDVEWMFGVKDGFDIVIGNPPYLRVQGIRNAHPQLADYLANNYKSATGKFDLYVSFIERGLSLTIPLGILNFIMPTKWTNSDYGIGIRRIILQEKISVKMINFSSFQVFNASTYTGLQWFFKNCNSELEYLQMSKNATTAIELSLFLQNIQQNNYIHYSLNKFSEKPWKLSSDKSSSVILDKFEKMTKLNAILDYISQGVVSTGDDIFIMQGTFKDNYFVGYSNEIKREVLIEKNLMKPLLKGEDVKQYTQLSPTHYIIYPHHLVKGKTVPYTEKEMQNFFPQAYAYLLQFKEKLTEKKIKYKTNPLYWYSLHRSREISMFENKKIITPEISLGCNMTLDEIGLYHNTKCYTIQPNYKNKQNIYTLLGILNSKLFWFYLVNTGYILRGGFFTFKTKYIENFPIPLFNSQATSIEIFVKKILDSTDDEERMKILTQIDILVYHLYELSYDEILIVDPETPITRDEYEK